MSPKVKKQLFLGFALRKQIQYQAKKIAGSKKKRQIFHEMVGSKVLKSTGFRPISETVPNKANKILNNRKEGDELKYIRKTKVGVRSTLSHTLIRFFEDDRVSRQKRFCQEWKSKKTESCPSGQLRQSLQ